MELVYLYVEDYKNIKNQGFNFSPRFECSYDKESNTLDIREKDKSEYIENFFGENINVTAIVGKNGSGKTAILNCIIKLLNDNTFRFIFLVVKYKNKFYFISSNKDTKINCKEMIEKASIEDFDFIYFNTEHKCPSIKSEIIYSLENISFYDQLTDLICSDSDYYEYQRDNNIVLDEYKISEFLIKLQQENKIDVSEFFDIFIDYYYVHDNTNYYLQLLYSLTFYLIHQSFKDLLLALFNEGSIYDIYLIEKLSGCLNSSEEFSEFLSLQEKRLFIDYEKIYYTLKKNKVDVEIKHTEFNRFNKLIEKKDHKVKFSNLKKLKPIFFKLFNFSFVEFNERSYSRLSYGEKNFLSQLVQILYKYISSKKDNMILILDEVEISLHPLLQKQYLNKLINILNSLDKRISIIFSTHSPFMLSDLPKENVLFISKDELGYCKISNGMEERKETLGANIHTLLTDSFFMEDGLMGEFAKKKIDEVIGLLNTKELSKEDLDYCEKVIQRIGEPILRRQLQKMLDSKRLSEVEQIKKQMLDLESRLNELENDSN